MKINSKSKIQASAYTDSGSEFVKITKFGADIGDELDDYLDQLSELGVSNREYDVADYITRKELDTLRSAAEILRDIYMYAKTEVLGPEY